MGRKRTGSIRVRGGRWYARFTLRSGKEWEHPIDPPADKTPYDEAYARDVVKGLLDLYESKQWDPERPVTPRAVSPESTVLQYVQHWIAKQTYESAPNDAKYIRAQLAPSEFAVVQLRDLKPHHALAWLYWLKQRPSARGGTLAPRTIRNAFDVVRRALDEAVLEELLVASPCRAVRKKLPAIEDKHPELRAGWVLSRGDVFRILHAESIHPERRVRYAILLLTGMRFGEFNALRFSDWDRTAEPLTKITVSRAIKSVSRKEGSTKTRAIKQVPVHPDLQVILDWWWESGWEAVYGRPPTVSDFVAPAARGKNKGLPSNVHACNRGWKNDQQSLGITPRHQHCARHTLISHVQDDGADGSVIRWITHAPPRTSFDGYTRLEWLRLCSELSKLKLVAPGAKGNPGK